MSKTSGNKVRVERWEVKAGGESLFPSGRKSVAKVTVRNAKGQFHGATNYKGSVL